MPGDGEQVRAGGEQARFILHPSQHRQQQLGEGFVCQQLVQARCDP